jgi:hypothetical protein
MSKPTNTSRRRVRPGRLIAVSLLTVALASLSAAPTFASVSEEQQGAQILNTIHAGKLKASGLSSSQYEHVGEYLMGRALGSTQLHERMNTLMDEMMGSGAGDQMHTYLGERYLGKSVEATSKNAPLYGLMGVMMSGYRGSPLASMMSRYLSGANQTNGGYLMGSGMMGYGNGAYQTAADTGMSTGAIVGIVLGSIAALALLIIVGLRMTHRRAPKAGTA